MHRRGRSPDTQWARGCDKTIGRAAKIRMLCGCCGVGGGVARASGMSDGACGGGAVPHVCVHVVVMFPM